MVGVCLSMTTDTRCMMSLQPDKHHKTGICLLPSPFHFTNQTNSFSSGAEQTSRPSNLLSSYILMKLVFLTLLFIMISNNCMASQPKMGTKKIFQEVKAAGVILITSPIECQLVCIDMGPIGVGKFTNIPSFVSFLHT